MPLSENQKLRLMSLLRKKMKDEKCPYYVFSDLVKYYLIVAGEFRPGEGRTQETKSTEPPEPPTNFEDLLKK